MSVRPHNRSWVKLGWLIGCGCFVALLAFLGLRSLHSFSFQKFSPTDPASSQPFLLKEISTNVVSESFQHKSTYTVDPKTRLLLVPHHLVAGREIASLLSSTSAPKRVLLLSPDHFSQGKQALSTTRQSFRWNEQTVFPDETLITQLTNALPTSLRVQDSVFAQEHGVRGLLPFLKMAWPQAQVSVMTVRRDTSEKTVQELTLALEDQLAQDSDLLVVITIDFSHELPAYLADLHDAHAIAHLQALDTSAFRQVEIDSAPLFLLLTTLARDQHSALTIQAQTNSLRLMKVTVTELGTSHVLASGQPNQTAMPLDQTFTLFHDPARQIISSEQRAYRGYDQVVTTTIPFPVVFVKEHTTSTTRWHAIPLQKNESQWKVVDDQIFTRLQNQRTVWEAWARTHLSTSLGE